MTNFEKKPCALRLVLLTPGILLAAAVTAGAGSGVDRRIPT